MIGGSSLRQDGVPACRIRCVRRPRVRERESARSRRLRDGGHAADAAEREMPGSLPGGADRHGPRDPGEGDQRLQGAHLGQVQADLPGLAEGSAYPAQYDLYRVDRRLHRHLSQRGFRVHGGDGRERAHRGDQGRLRGDQGVLQQERRDQVRGGCRPRQQDVVGASVPASHGRGSESEADLHRVRINCVMCKLCIHSNRNC